MLNQQLGHTTTARLFSEVRTAIFKKDFRLSLDDVTRLDAVAAHGGMPKISTYSVSKAALNSMTKIHAYELRAARIRYSLLSLNRFSRNGPKLQFFKGIRYVKGALRTNWFVIR